MSYTNLTWDELLKKANNWFDLPRIMKEGFRRLRAQFNGGSIIVNNPITDEESTLDEALEDLSENSGGGTPNFQEVTDGTGNNETTNNIKFVNPNFPNTYLEVFQAPAGAATILRFYELGVLKNKIVSNTSVDVSSITGNTAINLIASDVFQGLYWTNINGGVGTFKFPDYFDSLSQNCDIGFPTRNIGDAFTIQYEPYAISSSITADLGAIYTANGTLTVTDPTPETNKGYIVHVIGGTSTIGGVGYTSGALVYRFYNGSDWISSEYLSSGTSFIAKNYASDVDAAAGGIGIGRFYHTAGTVKIRLT